MEYLDKTKEELIIELQELHSRNKSLEELYSKDIAERIQAQDNLMRSEIKHRTILQTAMDGFWLLDKRGQILEVNESLCKMCGYTSEELTSKKLSDLEAAEATSEVRLHINSIIEKGEDHFDTRLRRKDGTIFDVEISVKYQPEDGGRLVAFLHDITARLQVVEALKDSREKYSKIFDRAPVLISITDLKEATYIDVNDFSFPFSGYSKEEVIGHKSTEVGFVSRENRKKLEEVLNKEGKIEGLELKFKTKTGNDVYGIVNGDKVIIDNNECLLTITTDITQRKLMEEALRLSEKNLNKAQEVAHVGSWKWTISTNKLEWSNEMYKIFGLNKETFTGILSDVIATAIHPDDRDRVDNSNLKVSEQGVPIPLEYRIIWPDSSVRTVWAEAGELIRDEAGNPAILIGIVQDITDRKLTEQELVKSKEKAEGSDRLKSAFLANMSHEIRTPMNGILGFASLLKEPGLTGEMQKEFIDIIENSGKRMLNIINDIVDISKIESGQMEVNLTETNVNSKLEDIYNFFRPEAEQKGLHFYNKNNQLLKAVIVKTDSEKLYAILTNLVKNAIKFTNRGFVEIGFDTIKTRRSGNLQFYVKDTGIGIPEPRQHAVFDRFVQADISDTRAFQGAGLGLSISKAYVEMLGGKIWVESQENKGSAFFFTIPLNIASEEVKVDESLVPGVEFQYNLKDLKILIVEDDKASEMLIGMTVRSFSREILKARSGYEAIDACRNHPDIDLIIMDIKIPGVDGYEATRQIRQFNKSVVIIAQTAFALIGDKDKAIEAGCNDYISKPTKKELLLRIINKQFIDAN